MVDLIYDFENNEYRIQEDGEISEASTLQEIVDMLPESEEQKEESVKLRAKAAERKLNKKGDSMK